MDIILNQKIIKDMCGTASFRKGEAFWRSNKVTLIHHTSDYCEATVTGAEDFQVIIKCGPDGDIQMTCSCPKLASFEKECQHVAAVLLSLNNRKQLNESQDLTVNLMTLFQNNPVRSSAYQRHFENRSVLAVEFVCQHVSLPQAQNLMGIKLKIDSHDVPQIHFFLESVRNGNPYFISESFLYDPALHCFEAENDAVIQKLIEITGDKQLYPNPSHNSDLLVIPTSIWQKLIFLLKNAPFVDLEYKGQRWKGFYVVNRPLPLNFYFSKIKDLSYALKISGMNEIIILSTYSAALYDGKVYKLDSKDSERLIELKKLLSSSTAGHILIPKDQLSYFLEKIVPAFRNLGKVHIDRSVTEEFQNPPLITKIYLDRLKNRLLAALEFHYDTLIINPVENREPVSGSLLVRDTEMEERILDLMDESGFTKTESGYYLHHEELEFDFLYYQLPKLQKLGQVFATTAVRNRISKESFRPQIRVKVKKDRVNWLEFKFKMDGISDDQIREVLSALEEKRKYYRLPNGSFLSLETKEFETIQRFLQVPQIKTTGLTHGLDLPLDQCLQLLDQVEVNDSFELESSYRKFMETLRNPGSLKFDLPVQLKTVLRDYQKQGFQWMKTLAYYGFGGILADDMGLGKTLQSITFLLSNLTESRKSNRRALIVCPASLTYNWLSEILKFAPEINAIVMDGSKKARGELQNNLADVDVIITSYPLLRKDIPWYETQSFHTIFFDEAQAFKNPLTHTARAVKRIRAGHRFALTGTPVENTSEELWSIFHVVFPELFLGLKEFSQLTKKKIARRIRPFLLRRLKSDVLPEFPKKLATNETVELLPDQKKLYTAYLAKLRHDTLKHLDKDTIRKNRIKILAGLTRLRQICCHPALFADQYEGSSAKYDQLMQIVEEAKFFGRRLLIFSQFTKMLKLIGKELTKMGLPFFYLDGQTPSEERIALCNRYNAGERDVFLISLKAGGTGLNLMSADTVILYDTWWNPAVEEQAADRAYRIGQRNDVRVIKLITQGTIEEKMHELQDQKRLLINEIIEAEDRDIAILSEEDIKEILMM